MCQYLYWLGRSRQSNQLPWPATGIVEFGNVGLHCFLFAKSLERLFEDLGCPGMRRHDNAVMHPLALASCPNNARVSQICQMPRDFGLRGIQDLYEIADADFTISHKVQQTQPRRISQCLEESRQVELSLCGHADIFALTNTRVKYIVVLANML